MTSAPANLVEMIIKNRVVNPLDDHDLIETNQHGFCKGKLCLSSRLEVFECVDKIVAKELSDHLLGLPEKPLTKSPWEPVKGTGNSQPAKLLLKEAVKARL